MLCFLIGSEGFGLGDGAGLSLSDGAELGPGFFLGH